MGTISTSCPHCNHDKSLFSTVWTEAWKGGAPHTWQTYLQCIHCHKGIGSILALMPRQGVPNNPPTHYTGNLDGLYVAIETWPDSKQLSAPQYTPQPVAKRFVEGEDAFSRKNWNSAVAMYRSALDIATKGMNGVPKLQFFARLKWMFENGKITQNIKDWADHVRVEGNDALHDPEEFSEEDATALRFFTEMFLRYVFELPGKVDEFRARQVSKP